MTTRKQIRDTVAQLLEPALLAFDPNLQVFTFKKTELKNADPIVCVYLEEADIENGIDYAENDAQLSIHVVIPNRNDIDDALDDIGAVCETVMQDNLWLDGLLTNQLHSGWKYERDLLPGMTGLTLTYQIRW